MGAIIEQLGYKLVWSAGSCKLYPPDGKSLRLRVKNGCPELVESQALTLISRLEEHKMQQVEELRRRTDEGKDRIRQAKIAMQRTWWDHLVEHVSSSAPAAGHMAVSTAPFFQDVPDRALSGLLPSEDVDSKTLWKALEEGMPNLNRRRRKALHRASNWVVHLFAGPGSHKAFKRLESQDTVVVELDICRSRSQDLYHDPLWTLLAKVAKLGRVAAVIGGPPTRTWSMSGHRADGPHPLRSPTEPFGLSTLTSDERDLVDRDTGLYARMLWLHALSTAGRCVHPNPSDGTSMVAFMLEQPSVEHHMASSHSAVGGAPADSRVSPVWAPGFVQAIVYALQRWPCYRIMKFTQADWEQHVANNHVPYRRDCAVCVHGAGNGRRHHGVVHPDVYCMSADIAGPIRVKGKDPESRNHRPATFKYFLAVSYRFPRLKGVKEESDPSQTEGFDDAALLPGGTDDLADEAFPAAEGPPHEDYEDSLYEPSLAEEEEEAEGEGVEGPREFAAKVAEEHPWESARCELETPPDMARLVFAVPLHTNKGDDILNALQQVYISLRTLWPCAIMTAAAQQRAQQLGMKSKLAIHFGGKCSVKRKFFSKKGDLEDRWVEGKYMGLSPSVNDGHIVLRSDGVGNGFVQTLHVRTRLVSPDPPPLQFVGDSLEEEHTPPPRRVRGKRSAGVRLDDVFALDPPPPLPPPAEALHPEGPVSPVEEESARVARLSLQDLEGLATELIEDDWDLDEALWVLAEVCRAAPQLQHKAGLYRHGGVVGVLGGTTDKPWLTELMNMVLSAVAPTAEYTSLWLSNSTVQPVHADHHNLQGSTNVVLPLKLPPNGGDLWIELKPGDLVSGPVEERVDGKGRRWLGTTHKLERGKPFFLDPTRRHATTPWKGERAVLVGYTVNTLGKELEHEFQSLEALGFPLPASVRLPLTEQQDVRRLDAFDCFEEEPLQETKARHPDGKTSELTPGTVLKGGGWKKTQAVEAGTVELEVSWNLKHSPDQRRTQSEHALLACQPDTETQVEEEEEEEGLSEDSLPEQPVLWELWVPHPQTGEQLCVLRSDDSDASEACALCKSEPVYTTNVELLLDRLQEPLQVVHTVDPRDAEQCIEKWMPSIHKEIGVIEKAVRRLPPAEVRSGGWLKRKEVKVVPSKFVFTVKPPDPAEASLATRKGQAYHKRKARLVACGNHAPGTGSEVYASGAAAETLRCFVIISSKRNWCIGSLDVTSAFLLTPIPQGRGFPVFALTPPRLLVRLGLAEEGELWILTHAVYGLRESPKLWSDFRDCQLRALRCVVDGVELQLQQGRLDPNWWRVVRTSDGVVVGGLLTYVDDFLLAGSKEVIEALATAIQGIWKTTPLAARQRTRKKTTPSTAQGRNYSTLAGWISQ
ncbi:GIP [Symbiodinium sp. CCMP2592]|nr:GIP [Symbiodinium sp. CCMP2592]